MSATSAVLAPLRGIGLLGLLLASTALLLLSGLVFLVASQAKIPSNAPRRLRGEWPVIGSYGFFQERWRFCWENAKASATGNFSFHVGPHAVAAIHGEANRKLFLDSNQLDFGAGYSVLFQGGPDVQDDLSDAALSEGFYKWLRKTIVAVTRRERLVQVLPTMLNDARTAIHELGSSGITDPFDSIYELVYWMSMRIIGPNEISNDRQLLKHTLQLLDKLQSNAQPMGIIAPWMPLPSTLRRAWAGLKLYNIYAGFVRTRQQKGIRENDTLQELLDQGISTVNALKFTFGTLFAAQINTSINAAAVLCYLAVNDEWRRICQDELRETCAAHVPAAHQSLPLLDQLQYLPADTWDQGLPNLYLCLRESIRMQLIGTAFRRNNSGREIPLPGTATEVLAPGQFVVYNIADAHYNPAIYPEPREFDPARYTADRREDAKAPYAWMGWGGGRHPCLGMKTARMEYSLIAAHFLAQFDFSLADAHGAPMARVPDVNIEGWGADKPTVPMRLRYTVREKP